METMRRWLAALLCLVMMLSCTVAVFAVEDDEKPMASQEAYDAADALYALGLFQGTGVDAAGVPVYDLERTPNRHEAVTMLIRLLGKEAEAKATPWTAPFTDVALWAKPYVGYAYKNDITRGTGATTFGGSAATTVSQYITFMLRTLGYSSDKDFEWDAAWELSDKIGMTNGQYNAGTKTFTRGDMVVIAFSALSCKMTDGTILLDYLSQQGSVKQPSSLPWENGGKTPDQYTWAEFEALTVEQQDAFVEWFSSVDAFYAWVEKADGAISGTGNASGETPVWNKGGKTPDQYTWEEFEALTDEEKEAFYSWFATVDDYIEWMDKALVA